MPIHRIVDLPYRFALVAFVFCLLTLVALLVPWLSFVFGPEVSIYDIGSPQLRAFT